MTLTWKEFKDIVNEKISDSEEIQYIDVSYPHTKDNIRIEITELGFKIED